ncbi:nitronate monooxygenase [Mycolicibacterium sp.]|uniref:NAD(P)H-dependent flavin oxidoreductase n=1 Tax=Mycolicibacterium sp. TaxID=2320850 RepID=UPI0025F31F29|nr:nitronate monooxygenase [Mycolicibacterium sp.]
MTAVSGLELTIAACRSGVIGAFPTHNAPDSEALDGWLGQLGRALTTDEAPFAANLVVHRSNDRRTSDLDCLVRHGVELVITSVGSPAPVIETLHAIGTHVYADVASLDHAWRAMDAGADGLVLLTAGAGGQTGWANPFAFVRAIRERYDGPVVLAGGISDGCAVYAAEVLGADLAYLGTRFIATHESAAPDDYRRAVVASTLDDVRLSSRIGGIPASLLASWLDGSSEGEPQSTGFAQDRLLANQTAWSAGHSVSGIHEIASVGAVVSTLADDYRRARSCHGKVIND